MSKQLLLLCHNNNSLSIIAQAILGKYLKGVETQSAGIKPSQSINQDVKKALIKDGSWSEEFHTKEVHTVLDKDYDLVIVMSSIKSKNLPEFSETTTVIEIEYEEPNYKNSTNIERFIKTIKMELIPITRDILEL